MKTRLTALLQIEYPVIQGGMAWVAESTLAAAVSNAGGLGLIAAANAPADWVRQEIRRARTLTDRPFGVNIMLMSPYAAEVAEVVAEERVAAVTTGAGNPGKYIPRWKECGIVVIPVVPSASLALRMERLGADAVVAEGTESGGHIGELTTMTLVPQVKDSVTIPVVAAGGIADGRGVAAVFMLGAEGVQVGTRFLAAEECRIHENYKKLVLGAADTDTIVTGRAGGHPVRSLKSPLTRRIAALEKEGNLERVEELGAGSLRKAAVDGSLEEGSFMAGQIAGLVKRIEPAADIVRGMISEAEKLLGCRA